MDTYEKINKYCKEHCFSNVTKNYTICTEYVYIIQCKLYPKRILDIEYLVPVSVLVTFLFLTGLAANLCVCAVIVKHPTMRTETNIYLFSLAISDLCLLVFGLPPELWHYWQIYPYALGDFTCRLTNFMAATGTWASVLTIVAFSIERYDAICHPLRVRSKSKRVVKVILAIWIISVTTSLPILYLYNVDTTVIYPGTQQESFLSLRCSPDPSCKYCRYMYFITSVIFFFIPMVILALVYTKIAFFLRSNSKFARNCGIQNSCSENRRTFNVLVVVVLSFFSCWAPFHYQRVAAPFVGKSQTQAEKVVDRYVFVVTGVFYYLSATINPLLYNVMSKRYRKAFMDIIWQKTDSKSPNDMSLMNSTKYTGISSKKSTTT